MAIKKSILLFEIFPKSKKNNFEKSGVIGNTRVKSDSETQSQESNGADYNVFLRKVSKVLKEKFQSS